MPDELFKFVSPLLDPLEKFQWDLAPLITEHRNFYSRIRSIAASLVEVPGSTGFSGTGAQAYLAATEHYIADSERVAQHLDQACSAISQYRAMVWLETNIADSNIYATFFTSSMAEVLISFIMDHLRQQGLEDVIKRGQDAIQDAMNGSRDFLLHRNIIPLDDGPNSGQMDFLL